MIVILVLLAAVIGGVMGYALALGRVDIGRDGIGDADDYKVGGTD